MRCILQRYRAIRIKNPLETIKNISSKIASEIEDIWLNARVPTREHRNCVAAVSKTINEWKKCHNYCELKDTDLYKRLDTLFDIKPMLRGGRFSDEDQLRHLKTLMRQNCELKLKCERDKYNWETDYEFYIDQYKGDRVQRLGSADIKLQQSEKQKEEREAKRLKYYDEQTASTSQARYDLSSFILYNFAQLFAMYIN